MTDHVPDITPDGGSEGFAEQILRHLASEAERAANADPFSRLQILATSIQQLAGWATRWAIGDLRRKGMSWAQIAAAVGAQHSTVLRQYQSGGPVITARPAGPNGDDGQGPLRRAATKLVHATFPTTALQNSPTGRLYLPVQAMADSMLTPVARPLLTTVKQVLAEADTLTAKGYPATAAFEQERAVWEAIGTLREVFTRDQLLIEAIAATTGEPQQ